MNLRQRFQYKTPQVQARVGDLQVGGVDDLVAEEQQIDVDGARGIDGAAFAAEGLFDGPSVRVELFCGASEVEGDHGIVKIRRVIGAGDGFGLVDAGLPPCAGDGDGLQGGACFSQVGEAVAEIRA